MSETKPIIFISPYEHHSNYLIWNETFAEVVEINLNQKGEIDLKDLETKLTLPQYQNRVKIGSFSAASNITGIKTDVYAISQILHQHNALAFFDYAASAPYVKIDMHPDDDCYLDAIFFSPHKFIGGPGSSGILVLRKDLYSSKYAPTIAGGGTVNYVSPYFYQFTEDVEQREKAGTPGILQILKASLALELKHLIGTETIHYIEQNFISYAMNKLNNHPNIDILGPLDPTKRISILSFNIKDGEKLLHHKFVASLMNDLFGIQSRAGCACAGPYGHRLLGIDQSLSQNIFKILEHGLGCIKPGFVRVNFHYLMSKDEVDFICEAILFIASYGHLFLTQYHVNLQTGSWNHLYFKENTDLVEQFGIINSFQLLSKDIFNKTIINKLQEYSSYLNHAFQTAKQLEQFPNPSYQQFHDPHFEEVRWFNYLYSCN